VRNPVFAIETDPGIFTPVGEVTGPIMVARRDRGEEYLAETTFYYGCRQVAPITNTPPYDSCIWKGVVYHWNISRTHQYEIYRSWRTFSNPAQAAAQQQELAEAARTAQILGAMFPEEFKMNMDGRKTMTDWIEKSRTGAVLALRPLEEVKNAVDQMAKLAGARHVGGVDESATPGPAA